MTDAELAGTGVLITRPEGQADELRATLKSRGGNAVMFPAIEIVPRDAGQVAAAARELTDPDISIFISTNAVHHGIALAGDEKIAAIGPATTAAIEASGRAVDIVASRGFDSDSLLAHPSLLDVDGKVIRIIRGSAGRGLIARVLRERGASVDYLEVYERRMPRYSDDRLAELEDLWRTGGIDIVTVMSVESLQNLIAILPRWCRDRLGTTPLVTPAKRVIKEAEDRFPGIPTMLASGPQARDMLDAILACNRTRRGKPR